MDAYTLDYFVKCLIILLQFSVVAFGAAVVLSLLSLSWEIFTGEAQRRFARFNSPKY